MAPRGVAPSRPCDDAKRRIESKDPAEVHLWLPTGSPLVRHRGEMGARIARFWALEAHRPIHGAIVPSAREPESKG
jgi:hypothetical protein